MRAARTASRTGPARRARSSPDSRWRLCLQWCTGSPGVVDGPSNYLDEDLVLAGAELVWHAGAHEDEKGHGLCHGTSGDGFALLKAFARTGDERRCALVACFANRQHAASTRGVRLATTPMV